MRRTYSFILYLFIPFILFRLYWKGKKLPAYRQRIHERFGRNIIHKPVDIWLHAVSLGEVNSAIPLLERLLSNSYRILVTTMTPTGSERVRAHFGERLAHQYIPYDLPILVQRFFKKIQPKIGIILETELWPNLIFEAKRQGISLFLLNARLSDKAFRQYAGLKCFFSPLLKKMDWIFPQSPEDEKKFIALGSDPKKVRYLGQLKFDLPPFFPKKNREEWFGKNRLILIAASTHEGEEMALLKAFPLFQKSYPQALLCIAPRHPERFQAIHKLSQQCGFRTRSRSQGNPIPDEIEVLVLDTLGELVDFYALSDVAFVGGSLVPVGGHNVIEPIHVGIPTFCGPFMQNSKHTLEVLMKAHAIQMVQTAEVLMTKISELQHHPDLKHQQVEHAKRIFLENQGTLDRYIDKIDAVCRGVR